MEMKDVLRVTFVLRRVLLIALPSRLPTMRTAEDIPHFSELIFRDVFIADFAKKPALHMPFSSLLPLR